MFAVSGIACMLFLGGWSLGLGFEMTDVLGYIVGNIVNVVVFIFKGWFLVFVMMWVRWTLPRLRIDQVMMTCLKYLVPISCVLLLGVSLWQLVMLEMPNFVQENFNWVLFAGTVVAVALVVKQLFTWASLPPGSAMPGMYRSVGVTGYQAGKQVGV
jgi:NADH-quinone oxidoreductase subunit H